MGVPALSVAAEVIAGLAALDDVEVSELSSGRWLVVLPGSVRWRLPVVVDVGERSWTAAVFILRGPWRGRGDPAGLHRHLLRRNLGLRLCHFSLDGDDDVLLSARLPLVTLTPALLDAVLAELLQVSEAAFEALVHRGYPGIFPPLPRTV